MSQPHSSTSVRIRQDLADNQGRLVATVSGDLLRATRRSSIHQLRSPAAWCFDASILDQARALGAVRVMVHDLNRDAYYLATLPTLTNSASRSIGATGNKSR